jgi:DNA-binding response OmpR family regulator
VTNDRQKVLIVDDEPEILSLLEELLSEEFETKVATNGKLAVEAAKLWHPHLIVMDIMMPEMDGMNAMQKLREDENTRHIPLLMLTALNTSQDRVKAFNLGADDFISKPFELDELIARVRSKLKRVRELRNTPPETVTVGNLNLESRSREVKVNEQILDLSPAEYGILTLLLARQGQVVSRKEIMQEVWEDEAKSDRLIDAHVTSLRKKIAGFSGEIHTVYGEGYRLKDKA